MKVNKLGISFTSEIISRDKFCVNEVKTDISVFIFALLIVREW
jgi:hypothetical protein